MVIKRLPLLHALSGCLMCPFFHAGFATVGYHARSPLFAICQFRLKGHDHGLDWPQSSFSGASFSVLCRFRSIDINNGGLCVFNFNVRGEAMLKGLNMTAHMYSDHVYPG
ncbi:hypothetical protein V8G54_031539 [Vigna mungo]|uniref:Secreted protein n=1 Tax=Vigna mungo TaxID=3915 RepID=A0AAQ3MK76_VIGMU